MKVSLDFNNIDEASSTYHLIVMFADEAWNCLDCLSVLKVEVAGRKAERKVRGSMLLVGLGG